MAERKFFRARNIIIIIISIILLASSVAGITIFLKDKGEAEAAEQDLIDKLPVAGNNEENNETGEDGVTPINPETQGTDGSTSSSGTAGGSNQGGTSLTEEEILSGITETVVEQERKVYEDLKLSWTTISIPTIKASMGIYKPELQIEKTATGLVKVDKPDETIEINSENVPMVRPGDSIIYTIKVSNIGNYKATNVVITETLDVMFDGKEIKAGEPLVKLETLDYGKVATLKVAYVVTEEDIAEEKNIKNIAYVVDGNIEEQDDDYIIPVNPDIEDITGTKTWVDNQNAYNTRPESIMVNLLADGVEVAEKEVKPDASGDWKYEFTNLPKYNDKKEEIVYTITEDELDDYTYQVVKGTYDITNTIKQEKLSITVNKVWVDENIPENRPTITIGLYKNNNTTPEETITIENDDELSYTFTELEKYSFEKDGDGNIVSCTENVYVIKEVKIGEETVVNGKANGYVVEAGTLAQGQNNNEFTQTITNTADEQATTTVTVYKEWVTPHIMTHPDIHIQLYQNGVAYGTQITLTAGTDGVWEQSELQYTWTDLPKYKLNNGELVIENGVVQINKYTVQEIDVDENVENLIQYITTYSDDTIALNETEITPDKTITNTAKGVLETVTYLTALTTYTRPVDVVLVLDTSGSMAEANSEGNSKAKDMVTAVNETITTIMSHNPLSKVAVVTYSNSATTILPLGRYEPLTTDTTDINNPIGQYLTCTQGSWSSRNGKYSNVSISTNVNDFSNQQYSITGATYIQGGIAQGANILIGADTVYDPDGVEGTEPATTRIPVLLLLSDGEPTKRTTSYNSVGNATGGNGSSATWEDAYYTILTANAYKAKIEENYGDVNFYTIGYGADTLLLRTVLNPDTDNIDECKISRRNSKTKNLYDELEETTAGAYGYDYADGSYTSETMSATELSSLLNHFIHSSVPSTEYRIFNRDEIVAGKVYLNNIDTTDGFSLTYGNTTYLDLQNAIDDGIVVLDTTNNEYYLNLTAIYLDLYNLNNEADLANVEISEQIYVKYHEKKS